MLTEREEMIVRFMREAIDQGYPAKQDSECEHHRFYYEECIACYDSYLHGKLDAVATGEAFKKPPATIPYETWSKEPSVGDRPKEGGLG